MNIILRKFLSKNKFIFTIIFKDSTAQNLVKNPSFEEYYDCPSNSGQLTLAKNWITPTINNAEYFNTCSTSPDYSVPFQNTNNYQEAKTGEAFIGLILINHPGLNYREYAQGELFSYLEINKKYHVSFYINKPNGYFGGKYAINNIALSLQAFFSESLLSMDIYKFGNPVLNDTINWVKIEGIYTSNGTEKYIVIGNFKPDSDTDTLDTSTGSYPSASYFIDDVSVEEITEPFWQYRDTTIHYGDSVLIGPALTGLDINWYTANDAFLENAPGIYVKPETSRNYIAKEMFNGVETTHLVHVTVLGGVGLVENELENVAVYPNPSNGTFSLRGLFLAKTGIKIYNLAGQCVWAEEINEGINSTEKEINVSLENGVYVLELRNERGSLVRRKLRIEN